MRLERDTTNYPIHGYTYKDAHSYDIDDRFGTVYMPFSEFGGQNSSFRVHLEWEDVERAIAMFVATKQPDALRLQRARKMDEVIRNQIEQEAVPQSN